MLIEENWDFKCGDEGRSFAEVNITLQSANWVLKKKLLTYKMWIEVLEEEVKEVKEEGG